MRQHTGSTTAHERLFGFPLQLRAHTTPCAQLHIHSFYTQLHTSFYTTLAYASYTLLSPIKTVMSPHAESPRLSLTSVTPFPHLSCCR